VIMEQQWDAVTAAAQDPARSSTGFYRRFIIRYVGARVGIFTLVSRRRSQALSDHHLLPRSRASASGTLSSLPDFDVSGSIAKLVR
ncbi:MAG TPA: hypothetical protein VIV60_04410, partial [Polyangiaceae bacterium]